MATCSQCEGIEQQFGRKKAEKRVTAVSTTGPNSFDAEVD
jgi:hypothetical protein